MSILGWFESFLADM